MVMCVAILAVISAQWRLILKALGYFSALPYGLARRYALGETLTAAVLLGIFVIAIAWIGKRVDARLKRK